jgi:Tol biopolymer transport system component
MTFPRRASLALALLTLAALAAAAFPHVRTSAQTAAPQQPASPNGKIVFQSDRGGDFSDIYVADADGKRETRLTTDVADDSMPVWSPDGSQIAFISGRRGVFEIFLMNADGSNQRPLREAPVEAVEVEWSPDSKMLAYDASPDFGVSDVYVVEAVAPGGGDSSAAPVNLTSGFGGFASDPSWAPNGTRLVFRGGQDLYTVDANGGVPTQITNTPDTAEADPAWAGGLIAYEGIRNFERAIYVINADGTGETKVSGGVGSQGEPVWSADGSRLAFVAASGDVYAVNANSTGLTLLNDMAGLSSHPFWSPDGLKVGFANDGDIHVVNSDGTTRHASNYTKTRRAFEQGNSWQKLQ